MSSTVFGTRNPFYGMRRYPDRGVIAGVCEGLAAHFDWNPRIVRVIAVLLLCFTGFWPTVVLYCVAWYVVEPVPGAPPATSPPPPAGSADNAAQAAAAAPGAGSASGAEPGPGVPMPDLKARFGRLEDRLRSIEACVISEEFELRRELKKLEA